MPECQKVWGYPTKQAALIALTGTKPSRSGQIPVRVYYCRQCQSYHFTSKPARKGRRKK